MCVCFEIYIFYIFCQVVIYVIITLPICLLLLLLIGFWSAVGVGVGVRVGVGVGVGVRIVVIFDVLIFACIFFCHLCKFVFWAHTRTYAHKHIDTKWCNNSWFSVFRCGSEWAGVGGSERQWVCGGIECENTN